MREYFNERSGPRQSRTHFGGRRRRFSLQTPPPPPAPIVLMDCELNDPRRSLQPPLPELAGQEAGLARANPGL